MNNKSTLAIRVLAILLVCLMVVPGWPATPRSSPELPDPGTVAGISKQQQEQLGLKAMGEVYQQFPVLPDSSAVTQYVQQLGRKLVTVIPQDGSWPYQFHVIPEKDINAFALPGGPIFINIGTITAADNEAELAGVMAHEMSHVYMQHSVKQASKESVAQVVLGVLGGVLPGGTAGNLARLGIQIGAGTMFLKYSRGDEAQADAVGAIIMYKAGYNPRAMAEFFQKLEREGGSGGPQFLSDHPNPGNRVAAVDKEIANWPPKNFQSNSPNFASAKQQATGVKAYTAQEIQAGAKQGVWAQQNRKNGAIPPNVPAPSGSSGGDGGSASLGNVGWDQVKPSGKFKELQSDVLNISYPDNWQAGNDQSSGGITIAPQAGVGQGAVAYGVVIGGGQDQNANSLDQATEDLVQSLQQSNPGLQASGNPQPIRVNGMEGRSVTLKGNSPIEKNGKPEPERDWLVTVPRPQGGLIYLVFIAPENDFSRLSSTYDKILNSLQLK
ncbi:MAG TPA: M48 family metallopeptidase [Terriglobales bacterium]|nr:M48 family metallopeptidase [Terriglobales bacterium]